MNERILIACTMQMDTVKYVLKKYHLDLHIEWVDRKLHNQPEKLHCRLQDLINDNQQADEIILTYGLCGNAVLELCSPDTRLILPKQHDCICQLLAFDNNDNYPVIPKKGCFYITREWTLDKEAIVQQCESVYAMYGKKEGQTLINEIYADYHTIILLDTPAYDVQKIVDYVDKASEYTGMCVKHEKGSVKVLEDLITGNYGKEHLVLKEGACIRGDMFHASY